MAKECPSEPFKSTELHLLGYSFALCFKGGYKGK